MSAGYLEVVEKALLLENMLRGQGLPQLPLLPAQRV